MLQDGCEKRRPTQETRLSQRIAAPRRHTAAAMAPDRIGAYDLFGFSSAREYGTALKGLPTTLVRRFFLLRSSDELAEAKAESKHTMKQCLVRQRLGEMAAPRAGAVAPRVTGRVLGSTCWSPLPKPGAAHACAQ